VTRLGEPVAGTIAGVLCGVLFRLAAQRRDWRLPTGLNWQPRLSDPPENTAGSAQWAEENPGG
jgi:hypothetical protein